MPVIGTQQSPIRIVGEETIYAKLTPLKYAYAGLLPGKFKRDNFEFDIQFTPAGVENTSGKELIVGSVSWIIRKIHIHSPAEHNIDEDDPARLECHLLHSLPGDVKGRGAKFVIGVFVKIVPKPPKKGRVRSSWFDLNTKVGKASVDTGKKPCTVTHAHNIDVTDFLPDKDQDKYYRYEGSLTSEPFSEDVSWYILKQESDIFESTIDEIVFCAEQEARPVHTGDRRFILRNFT